MKNLILKSAGLTMAAFLGLSSVNAQVLSQSEMQNMRSYGKKGMNVFEPKKETDTKFDGIKVRWGAGFTQSFQALSHSTGLKSAINAAGKDSNAAYGLSAGFNTAQANLYTDVLLADGIRLNLTTYLSARHHNETWVKGGYIQFDKLPLNVEILDNIMKYTTIKVGHMEINYGDNHFRRSDGGHTLYNPFVENYILDPFTTEIGGEIYGNYKGFMGMLGVSNGEIKGSVDALTATATDPTAKKTPAIYGKLAYDKTMDNGFRYRLAASVYSDKSSQSNTLMWGDRTGSNYFMTMERAFVGGNTATASGYTAQAWSGRLNPGINDEILAQQFNLFLKYKGAEFFGTYDMVEGRRATEVAKRSFNQMAADVIYRFGKTENVFVGVRYNTVSGNLPAAEQLNKITINRTAIGAGWFVTDNIMLKGEYVMQEYKDFTPILGAANANVTGPATKSDIRYNGKFDGFIIQATVGF
ncbi:MAG: hypothetical protein LCH37_09670 [Bacteroidetes bacterium]|nr:hypothetical protein [Bacteroidota bacterium]